jgi:hypothetical protein
MKKKPTKELEFNSLTESRAALCEAMTRLRNPTKENIAHSHAVKKAAGNLERRIRTAFKDMRAGKETDLDALIR